MFISSVVGRGTTLVDNADKGDEEEGVGIGEVTKDISGADEAANFLLPMNLAVQDHKEHL